MKKEQEEKSRGIYPWSKQMIGGPLADDFFYPTRPKTQESPQELWGSCSLPRIRFRLQLSQARLLIQRAASKAIHDTHFSMLSQPLVNTCLRELLF